MTPRVEIVTRGSLRFEPPRSRLLPWRPAKPRPCLQDAFTPGWETAELNLVTIPVLSDKRRPRRDHATLDRTLVTEITEAPTRVAAHSTLMLPPP